MHTMHTMHTKNAPRYHDAEHYLHKKYLGET